MDELGVYSSLAPLSERKESFSLSEPFSSGRSGRLQGRASDEEVRTVCDQEEQLERASFSEQGAERMWNLSFQK